MYSNSTFLTPSTSNSCLCVLNNRLPRLARYLQAVFIVTNSFGSLNKLELELELGVHYTKHVTAVSRKVVSQKQKSKRDNVESILTIFNTTTPPEINTV